MIVCGAPSSAIWGTIALLGLVPVAATFVNPAPDRMAFVRRTGVVRRGDRRGRMSYLTIRHEPRLAAVLNSTAQTIAFATVGAPLSYLAARSGFPLQDALFE